MNVKPQAAVALFLSFTLIVLAGPAHAADLTFVVTSDLHYNGDAANANNVSGRATIADINALAGKTYPSSIGGDTVRAPQFVALCGDVCNGYSSNEPGMHQQFAYFVADWGLNGEKLLHCPVYEGLGNHDAQFIPAIINDLIARNATRTGVNVSSNGLHYSWNMGGVHFIQANLFVGNDVNDTSSQESPPMNSLEFVVDDLRTRVGASGMPVVIFQHYGWDDFSFLDHESGVDHLGRWWTTAQSDTFYNAVKNYNVVGVFWGHTHRVAIQKWNNTIDVYNDGATLGEDFLVVHIKDTTMTVAYRYATSWVGGYAQKKRIATTPPVGTRNPGPSSGSPSSLESMPTFQYVMSSRQLIVSFRASSSTVKRSVTLLNTMGRVVKSTADAHSKPGESRVTIDCSDLASGVYCSRVLVGHEQVLYATAIR
jgi:hypothetical protein